MIVSSSTTRTCGRLERWVMSSHRARAGPAGSGSEIIRLPGGRTPEAHKSSAPGSQMSSDSAPGQLQPSRRNATDTEPELSEEHEQDHQHRVGQRVLPPIVELPSEPLAGKGEDDEVVEEVEHERGAPEDHEPAHGKAPHLDQVVGEAEHAEDGGEAEQVGAPARRPAIVPE